MFSKMIVLCFVLFLFLLMFLKIQSIQSSYLALKIQNNETTNVQKLQCKSQAVSCDAAKYLFEKSVMLSRVCHYLDPHYCPLVSLRQLVTCSFSPCLRSDTVVHKNTNLFLNSDNVHFFFPSVTHILNDMQKLKGVREIHCKTAF